MMKWFEQNRRQFSKAISEIQNGNIDVLETIPTQGDFSHIIGVTGAPGVGKSTFLRSLIQEYRKRNKCIAIIAVDPTSPYTGGAILGDRIRLSGFSSDWGVFIRSFGSRGSVGGLFDGIYPVVKLFEHAGFDKIIVETVGIGQVSLDISEVADTCIVLEAPGMGDDIQAIKAGITEVADIFVVNKSDRQGADITAIQLQNMLLMNPEAEKRQWNVPVIKCSSLKKDGFDNVIQNVDSHWEYMIKSENSQLKRQKRQYREFRSIIQDKIQREIDRHIAENEEMKLIIENLMNMKSSALQSSKEFFEILREKGFYPC